MSRIYEEFCELMSAYNEANDKWTPIQKAHELLGSVNEDEIWEQRNAAANALYKYIAELTTRIAKLEAELKITDGLLNQATVSIGAVIACCTYNSNAEAMAGAYGISYRAFTMIDNFIKNYNRAVLDGKASTDVKNIICWPPNPPEVQE